MEIWRLTINGEQWDYDDPKEAYLGLSQAVTSYFDDEDAFTSEQLVGSDIVTPLPFTIGAFFFRLEELGLYDAIDAHAKSSIQMMLFPFGVKDLDDAFYIMSLNLKHFRDYHRVFEEDETQVFFTIHAEGDDPFFLIESVDCGEKSYIRSNAFFGNISAEHVYFISHQLITTSKTRDRIGTFRDFDIRLDKVQK